MIFTDGEIDFPDPSRHIFKEYVRVGDFYFEAGDIIGFGGQPTVTNLLNAYHRGIFPWPMEGLALPWFCPDPRAILDFDKLRISRSLERAIKASCFTFTVDKAFEQVIVSCATADRGDGSGTWITDAFISSYTELNRSGIAHSIEVWNGNEELVGGIYGVDAGGVFCGESMFFKEPNASKLAILFLIERLRERGANWIDIQTITPHMERMGAEEISRKEFLDRLKETQERNLTLFG
jgi:leucyl/phenylalanyl-tRNA---protein transferase